MVLEERPPRLRGWRPPARHQSGDRPLRHVESQFQQLSVNARRAPEWVRSGHLSGHASHVGVDLRTTAPRTRPSGPVPCEAAAVASDNRRGSYDTKADFQSGQASLRPTQNSRSDQRTVGFGRVRWYTANCCRSARFSNTRLRCRLARIIRGRAVSMTRTTMVQHSRWRACGRPSFAS